MGRDLKVLRVEWTDASTSHGWQTKDDIASGMRNVSVGMVIEEDAKGLTLTESFCVEKDIERKYGCTTYIPKKYITRRRILK